MIPKSLSGEENQDSEPSLAVNPENTQQIAAAAFTPDPSGGHLAPIFVSTDGGNTWVLNSIVPGAGPETPTADITLAFGRGGVLYSAILRGEDSDTTPMNVLRTPSFTGGEPMKIVLARSGQGLDQPWVRAGTKTGRGQSARRIYVGSNDFNASEGRTATIDSASAAGMAKLKFRTARIESRTTSGQDGPPVRPVIHPDGTLYAVFHAWRTFNEDTGLGTADVVVVRDDHGGTGTRAFADLLGDDGKAGARVAQGIRFNFDGTLGLQRTGGDVVIAIDPANSDNVCVAYNDDTGKVYNLHLRRSSDRGATWSTDVRTIANALNGALAINDAGTLGLLYQQLTGSGAGQRWVTKLELQRKGSTTWTSLTLATTPARRPALQFDPYLGDYVQLVAVGRDFYGVFSANNTPRKANFPNGVTYQRNANFSTETLLDVDNHKHVEVSIDPFFFKVTP